MRSTRTLLSVAAVSAAALVLTSCGGGASQELTYEESPMAEFMSSVWGGEEMSEEDWQAEAEENERLVQESIAQCMQDEGFEYIPEDSNGMVFYSDDDGVWDPENRDWVAQYGFGVFNDPWQEVYENEEPVEYHDPNAEYVDSLSEAEQEAYYEVLNGVGPTDEEMEDPEFDWNSLDGGCWDAAYEEVHGSYDEMDEIYEQYGPLLERMWSEQTEGPEYVELTDEWVSCMADAGHPGLTSPSDLTESMYEKQNEFYEEQNAAYDDLGYENMTDEDWEEFDASLADPRETPEWAEAAEEEIVLALADFDCRADLDFEQRALEIQFAQEERFIEENRAELEQYRAALEQAS